MDQLDAFNLTKRTLINVGAQAVSEAFYEDSFGDFWVSFRLGGRSGSVTLDRMQMFIWDDLQGQGDCKLLFGDLRSVDQQELAAVLGSLFASGSW